MFARQPRETKFHPVSGAVIFNTIYALAINKRFERLARFLNEQEISSVNYRYGYYTAPYQLARDGQNEAAEALVKHFDANISDVAEGWAENGDEERAMNALNNRGADLAQIVRGFAAAGSILADQLAVDTPLVTEWNSMKADDALAPTHRNKFFGYAKSGKNSETIKKEVLLLAEQLNNSLNQMLNMTEQNQEMYLFLTLGTVFNTIFQGYAAAQRLDMATELFNNLSSYYNELGEDCLREYLDRAFLIAGNLPSKIGDSYVLESIAKHGHMRTDCLSINEINHDWHIRNVSSLACNKDLKLVNQYLTHENSRLKKVIDSKNMAATSPKNLKRLFYLLPPIITVESFKTQYSKVNISEKLLEHANQLREFRLYDGMSYPLATKWNFKVAVFLYIASKLFPTTTVEIACRVLEFYTGLPQEWIKEMIPSHKRYLENKAQHNPALKKENEAIRLLGNRLNYFTPPSNSTNTSVKSTVSPNNG